MKYYPMKFTRPTSFIWSVWLPDHSKKGSVIVYGSGGTSEPMVSSLGLLDWVSMYFERRPHRLKRNSKPRA